jgi:hypothetical protein
MSNIASPWHLVRPGFIVLLLATLLGGMVHAEDAKSPMTNLEDFVHYALVANVPMAEAHARALLDNVSDADLAELVDEKPKLRKRLVRAIDWARRVPDMEATVTELANRIESGRIELAHSPTRIKEAIGMLDGSRRDQLLGRSRLVAAGEYAVPGLVKLITSDSTNERLRWNAEQILVEIGREAVTPMTVVIPNVADDDKKRLIEILEQIRYMHAAPILAELATDPSASQDVRQAARRSLNSMGISPEASPAELHSELARMYFEEREDLIARPLDSMSNIWIWGEQGELITSPVPMEIYSPIMAMRTSEKALAYEPDDSSALAIYIAANLRRENRLKGDADPFYTDMEYSPQFYSTYHGPGIGQDVLVLGLDSGDTPLVRDALEGLAATSGQDNLFGRYVGREPLVDALQYPDRRVQFDSALVLARALPDQPFPASNRVIPLLASAIRTSGDEYAIVIAESLEDRQAAQERLEAMGFKVVGTDRSVARLADAISQSPGIDLAYVQGGSLDSSKMVLDNIRSTSGTINTPVVFSVAMVDMPAYNSRYSRDAKVAVVRSGISSDAFDATVESLLEDASGGRITGVDSDIYAIESLDALKSIALVRPQAYEITDAESSLVDALAERQDMTRMMVAEILSYMDSPSAQRALLDAALSPEAQDDRIQLLNYSAASVRRYGDHASKAQVAELSKMIQDSTGAEADAAAQVRGALNRPSSDQTRLTKGQGS